MIRKELMKQDKPELEYSFIGPIAIHKELHRRGIQPLPSLTTIKRVIQKHGLTVKKSKSKKSKSKVYYPTILSQHPNHRHELDLVTPRFISGYGKVVAINRIDVFSSHANLQIYQAKGTDSVLEFLVDDWKQFGIPAFLQVDNEASFRGGMYHERSFGKLMRFCLYFKVEIIFIPWKEPWRNPYIENFNGNFNRLLWTRKRFENMDHLRQESKRFLRKHNDYQAYKKANFSKPKFRSHTKRFLPKDLQLNFDTSLPITKGKIHFVRFVEEGGFVNILNEQFFVSQNLTSEYVWATIDTARETMTFYHQPEEDKKRILVKELQYKLREPVVNRIPINKL